MSAFEVTVTVDAQDRESATLELKVAGFAPVRVTEKRAAKGITAPHPFARASAVLDRPTDLDTLERKAYVRAYAKSCLAHARKNGIPAIEETRAFEWDRHPAAHKAGLAALRVERAHPSRAVTLAA